MRFSTVYCERRHLGVERVPLSFFSTPERRRILAQAQDFRASDPSQALVLDLYLPGALIFDEDTEEEYEEDGETERFIFVP